MDSFGLPLIRPDFLICSFYKIFGENPSGFGCLYCSPLGRFNHYWNGKSCPSKEAVWFLDNSSGTDKELEKMYKFVLEDELDTSNSFSGPMPVPKIYFGELEQGETSESQTKVKTGKKKASETSETETARTAAEQEVSETPASKSQTIVASARRKEPETSEIID